MQSVGMLANSALEFTAQGARHYPAQGARHYLDLIQPSLLGFPIMISSFRSLKCRLFGVQVQPLQQGHWQHVGLIGETNHTGLRTFHFTPLCNFMLTLTLIKILHLLL